MNREVLFHREFKHLTGGHLKVRDYFRHFQNIPGWRPRIYFSPQSKWDADNPWLTMREEILPEWRPQDADIWFLAGMDWTMLSDAQRRNPPVPVINLIQGFRHADPDWPLYRFLPCPAVRVCVSQGVAEAVLATGRVNGPVRAIENGIDTTGWPPPKPWHQREHDVLIYGHKWPDLAVELLHCLPSSLSATLQTDFIARERLLSMFANARVAVCLGPKGRLEGFLLPALEAMAQQTLVVTFDFVGNRGFCLDDRTCLLVEPRPDALRNAVLRALSLPATERQQILDTAADLAANSLARERSAFRDVLGELDGLWEQAARPGSG